MPSNDQIESILQGLADVNQTVEPIVLRSPPGSDQHVIAYAVHNLTLLIEELARVAAGEGRP